MGTSTPSRAKCRVWPRSRRRPRTTTSRMCTVPAASWVSSANSTVAGLHRNIPTVHMKRARRGDRPLGRDPRTRHQDSRFFSAGPAACRPEPRFRRAAVSTELDLDRTQWLHPRRNRPMPTRRTAASLSSTATSPRMAASSRPQVLTNRAGNSSAPRAFYESPGRRGGGHSRRRGRRWRCRHRALRGAEGWAGHAGNAVPDLLYQIADWARTAPC